jgi:hypothetical protein
MLTRRKMLTATLGAGTWLQGAEFEPAFGDPNQRTKRLILVHGRGQQERDPEAIKLEWVAALQAGAQKLGQELPTDIDILLPYYGDKLDGFARQWDMPVAAEIQARGKPEDNELLVFQWQVAEQLRTRANITDDQINAEYGQNERPRGPLNWEWVQAILRALDKYGPGMSKQAIELFTRDVFLYVTRSGVQDEIDRIVAKEFTEAPAVVVGHSLGSVVAYHILRTDRRPLKVPLYVTVGSPLGIRAIREQLLPLRFPSPPLGAWYNAFDTRDTVALYPLDSDNWPVAPGIQNYGGVRNQTDNRHGIAGYLNDPQVAARILDALT